MDYSPDYFSLPSRTESSSAPPPRTTDNSHFGLQPQGQAELQLDPVVWQHPQYANYLTPQSAHLPIHTGHYRRRSPASASPTSGFTVATASSIATERARMGPKRSSSGVSSGDAPPSSKVKINQPTSADAGHGKPRAKGHPGRTGQACDRCKNRKIKCDDETQACNNCRVAEAECLVTDRNTGKALPRGYLERLELQNVAYHRHIEELTEQLRQVGITPRPAPALASHGSGPIAAGSTTVQGLGWNSSQGFHGEGMNTDPMAQAIMASIATSTSPSGPLDRSLYKEPPTFRTGCHGDNYLGVSSDKHVSNIYGTTLQLLGMKIDIADFPSSEMDQSGLHNKSYESLLSSMFNVNKRITRVELPPRSEGVQGAEIYFVSTNSFLPLLHKPTFMTLLSRFYDDPTFKPSAAESVMVHMVFAIYYFQSAARNDDTEKPAKTQRSNLHYHYSLGFFHDLMLGHSLQDIQALGLICSHLRNFPKPGASWMITKISLTLASELGLHRSAQRWTSPLAQENPLELEMRKRVFYSIFSLHILLSGKLGRPMGMRLDDFDIEFPGAIDDSQISESGIDMSRPAKCSFEVGLAAAKWQILSLELYTTLYTVKRNLNDLPAKRHALEAKLERWYEELSPEMKINPSQSVQTDGQGMVFALWLQMLYLEFRMLLYHPSIDINDSAKSYRSSLEICQQTANQMRWSLGQLMQLRSLDTTWYNASVDVMAITVTLFAYYERKDELSYSDVEDLSNQMDQWLVIISAVGGLLGSGNRLNEAVSVVSARTIAAIKNHIDMRAANLGTGRRHSSHSPAGSHRYISPETAMGDATEPYQPSQQYAYPDPNSISSTVPYSGQNQMYNQNPYNNEGNLNVRSLAHVAAAATEAARDQPEQKVAFGLFPGQGSAETYGPGPQAWATWTRSVTDNLAAQDAYSASALMELGGRDVSAAEQQNQANLNASAAGPDGNATAQAMTGSHQHWPQMLFDVSGGNQHNG